MTEERLGRYDDNKASFVYLGQEGGQGFFAPLLNVTLFCYYLYVYILEPKFYTHLKQFSLTTASVKILGTNGRLSPVILDAFHSCTTAIMLFGAKLSREARRRLR